MIAGQFQFRFQEKVVYGQPFAQAAVAEVDRLSAKRVFVMSGRSLDGAPAMKALEAALGPAHVGTYSAIRPNSYREDVLEGANLAKAARADLLVAFGGGSVIDAVKVMQVCLWNGLTTIADLDAFRAPQGGTTKEQATDLASCQPRVLAIPTLLSGAEFTHFAGVTDQATGRKEAYEHPYMVPQVVILDPALLAATPLARVATSGVRAIDHCVEIFCSANAMPYGDALAVEGLRQLLTHLPNMLAGERDLNCFTHLQLGAWLAMSGATGGISAGASHAIGRVIGSLHGVEHGHTSSVMLPAVTRYNAFDDACRLRQEELMARTGMEGSDLSTSLAALFRALGQPTHLSEVGVGPNSFDQVADYAMDMLKHPSVSGNPRPITTRDQVIEILEIAR